MRKLTLGVLPFHAPPFAGAFGGFALNINVKTSGHRDARDDGMCVVIPFGKFLGGQLCLYEPGLIFDLRPGDVIAFPSQKITHFNLDFVGTRHSFVFHTDGSLRRAGQSFPIR